MVEIAHLRTLFECLEDNKPIPEYIRYDLKRIKEYVLNYNPDKDMVERIEELENDLDDAMHENEGLRNEICNLEDEISELKKHEYNPKG